MPEFCDKNYKAAEFISQNGAAEVQCEFLGPVSGLNFERQILGGEFLEGDFLLLGKTDETILAPKFRRPKFASRNSAPNSGSAGAKSSLRKVVPKSLHLIPGCKRRASPATGLEIRDPQDTMGLLWITQLFPREFLDEII